ncbi:MAG: ABC transporter permease [Thermoproteota archaeon]
MSSMNDYRPNLLRGLWALTARELKKWLKDPVMLLMFILQPLIWMGLLGKSIALDRMLTTENMGNISIGDIMIPGSMLNPPVRGILIIPGQVVTRQVQDMLYDVGKRVMQNTFGVADYFSYMAIGMISMIVVVTTMFSGMSIVWDRRLGLLDKILSTPVPRSAIIFSKMLNATLRAMFQATVILALAYIFGLQLSPSFTLVNLLGAYIAIFLLGIGLSAVFLAFSIRSTRMERPMQIVNLITMPLMFASNTFFPISLMPDWIQTVAKVNPLSYLTDALRQLTVLSTDAPALIVDFTYLGLFAAVSSTIGVFLSWKYLSS